MSQQGLAESSCRVGVLLAIAGIEFKVDMHTDKQRYEGWRLGVDFEEIRDPSGPICECDVRDAAELWWFADVVPS